MDMDEQQEVSDLSNGAVTEKYREAGKVVQDALQALLPRIVAGANIADLCQFGDEQIVALCAKQFKSKKGMDKGVAFPTSLSVNEVLAHFSPFNSESKPLAVGDVVKVDLGAHFDGFIAVAAHTVVVGGEATPVAGPRGDVMAAAYTAAEVAVRLIKPGNKNTQVTEGIRRVAEAFGVTPLAGVLMHEMQQYIIDANKTILLRGDDPEIKVEEFEFMPNEVYTVDVALSTGEGKPRESDIRTTVYKRNADVNYGLKMKASRALLGEIANKHAGGYMPFTLRSVAGSPDAEINARMGVVECVKHGVLQPYPVLVEREGVQTAHFKFTVLLLPGGTLKVTGLPLPAYVASDKAAALPADIKALLATEPYVSKKDKKAKKAGGAAAGAGGAEDVEM